MPDNAKEFEQQLQQLILAAANRLRTYYEATIVEITLAAAQVRFNGTSFFLKDYPALKKKIEKMVAKLHAAIYSTAINSIEAGWQLSNDKNDLLVDKRLAGKKALKSRTKILYDPNRDALDAFLARKTDGLSLSERVWDTLDGYKTEIEAGLGVGISEGKSAQAMARDMKQYLNEPDKLFRRVRDKEGVLRLSKAAREYHPGQGVYRSSYLNAKRLTATETNTSYRTADHERWKNMPFVTSIEVHTSNNHPKHDICDHLAGPYPKDFHFTGWHPFCRCYATPRQVSKADYEKYEDYLLGITDKMPVFEQVKDIPESAKAWISENAERISGWKNKPHWAKNNPQFVSDFLK